MTIAHQSDTDFLRTLGRQRIRGILDDEARFEAFVHAIDAGLRPDAKRMARRIAMKIMHDLISKCGIEQQTTIAQQIFIQLGARDETDARRMIEIVRQAENTPIEVKLEEAAAWMAEQLEARPDLRDRVLMRLARALRATPQLDGHANGGTS
jgi:hypothetical protein